MEPDHFTVLRLLYVWTGNPTARWQQSSYSNLTWPILAYATAAHGWFLQAEDLSSIGGDVLVSRCLCEWQKLLLLPERLPHPQAVQTSIDPKHVWDLSLSVCQTHTDEIDIDLRIQLLVREQRRTFPPNVGVFVFRTFSRSYLDRTVTWNV